MIVSALSLFVGWLTLVLTAILALMAFETLSKESKDRIFLYLGKVIFFWRKNPEEDDPKSGPPPPPPNPDAVAFLSLAQRSKRNPRQFRVLFQLPIKSELEVDVQDKQIDMYRVNRKIGPASIMLATASSFGISLILSEEAQGSTEVQNTSLIRDVDYLNLVDAIIADHLSPLASGWIEPLSNGQEEDDEDDEEDDE